MANWLFQVNIKHALNQNSASHVEVSKICQVVRSELSILKKRAEKSLHSDEIIILDDLECVIDNFGFLKDLCDGEINQDEWDDYGFDGDFVSLCDDYLNEMYDIGDTVVTLKNKNIGKFFWVK